MLSNSGRNDCFGRTSLVTVKNRGRPPACVACDWLGRYHSRVLCFWMCSRAASAGVKPPRSEGDWSCHLDGPQFNYEPFNSNSVNIRFWSWNYRGCWHQTCPPIVTRCWMALNIPHCISQSPEGDWEAYFFSLPHRFSRHWAICAPAALRRSGSYFSGSLSGIEP